MHYNQLRPENEHHAESEPKWDPEQLRRIQKHPCFSKEARHLHGRIHLPVAPVCNIECNYCVRKYDCVNESRPGVTSEILSPYQALERMRLVMDYMPNISVAAVAGPGDPLANDATFETLHLVRNAFPEVALCLSTNGLLLDDRMSEIVNCKVKTITVTLSAVDPDIAYRIVNRITYCGESRSGRDGAALLIKNQLNGICEAVRNGIVVKINSVLIPEINGAHLQEVARIARDTGAYMQNVIPLIPQHCFSDFAAPTREEKERVQEECGVYIRQMKHCRRCRSDAIGLIGQNVLAKDVPAFCGMK